MFNPTSLTTIEKVKMHKQQAAADPPALLLEKQRDSQGRSVG
jgi:hypothetical protein